MYICIFISFLFYLKCSFILLNFGQCSVPALLTSGGGILWHPQDLVAGYESLHLHILYVIVSNIKFFIVICITGVY